MTCVYCQRKPLTGNTVSHANNKHRTRQVTNVHRVRAMVEGRVRRIAVCTRCLRSGRVQKAL